MRAPNTHKIFYIFFHWVFSKNNVAGAGVPRELLSVRQMLTNWLTIATNEHRPLLIYLWPFLLRSENKLWRKKQQIFVLQNSKGKKKKSVDSVDSTRAAKTKLVYGRDKIIIMMITAWYPRWSQTSFEAQREKENEIPILGKIQQRSWTKNYI